MPNFLYLCRLKQTNKSIYQIGLTAGDITSGAIELNFDGETTGISRPTPDPSLNGGEWYDLQGHKLNGKPTNSGIYVNNGKKIVIK